MTTNEPLARHDADAALAPGEVQTDTKRKGWIQTLEGRKLDQRRLTPDAVGSIREIAHSLAGEFRFTRMTRVRYTVAEHAVRGSRLLPSVFAGAFLLHELSEVYLPDLSGPFKGSVFVEVNHADYPDVPASQFLTSEGRWLLPWTLLERQHTHVMLNALGLGSLEPLIYCGETKRMDWAMLAGEKAALHDSQGEEAGSWALPHPPPDGLNLGDGRLCWAPDYAEAQFLERFHELFGHDHDEPTGPR